MNPSRKTLLLFWRENMRHPGLFLGAGLSWLAGMTLQKLIMALIASRSLNHLIAVHNQAHVNYWHNFGGYFTGFVLAALLGQTFIALGLYLLSHLETRARPDLQMRAFTWLNSQSLAFHANTFSGSIVNQVNKFTAAYITLTDTFILMFLRMFTNVVIAIIVITFFSVPIALVMAVWTFAFAVLNFRLTKRRLALSKEAAVADTVLTGHLADAIGNISAVKAFGNEAAEETMHREKAHDRAYKKYRSWILGIKNDVQLGLMMAVLQIAVLALSVQAVLHHAISLGTLLLIQVYITQIISELWGLSNMSRTIEQAVTDAEEMVEIFDITPDVRDVPHPEKAQITKGAISFSHVNFAHDNTERALFEDFNLDIQPGEKIGLVGHSGSGKTTLTRLLLRFSDIDGGTLSIDGQNIAKLAQSDLRSYIAYVPQEPVLFHRSLRENIAYADPSATDKRVHSAAQQAHATEFIEQLPNGYDTVVGERGVKLSGGQRQRIAIARAILKNAPILVLDEATSALDSVSELLIQAALNKLMKGRTTIVIAHRLSTIQKMDRIVVMDAGRIIEQGTHAELLAAKGAYAKLWAHQSGGFIEA